MIPRSRFDPYRERPSNRRRRFVFVGAAVLLLAFAAPPPAFKTVPGASGDVYSAYDEKEVWRAVGNVLSVRYATARSRRSAVAAEAADLLPHFAARADSTGLHYVLIRANRPVVRMGSRFGLYRAWNFRYERAGREWVPSGYW